MNKRNRIELKSVDIGEHKVLSDRDNKDLDKIKSILNILQPDREGLMRELLMSQERMESDIKSGRLVVTSHKTL